MGISPTLSADGAVMYVGSYNDKLYAINTADGSVAWSFTAGDVVLSKPTLSADESVVFVGSHDKKLYAINTCKLEGETENSDV